ncbi:MAG: superoxide dismutase [Rhodospirillales bacterium]|nr:superoxide dismutase [Rhodospirillales bacterium]
MAEAMPPLPYPDDALAPVISATTIGFHYGKHHKAYYDNMVRLVAGTDFANHSVEEIVRTTLVNPNRTALYNNAAQVWNHTFYWNSMRPNGGGEPSGALAERIANDFGDFGTFRQKFIEAAVGQFGSGWAWLVEGRDKKLQIVRTGNADTPMAQGLKCLLACDVWEHAYYLDWQNRRADYVAAWLDKLANWEFASRNLSL